MAKALDTRVGGKLTKAKRLRPYDSVTTMIPKTNQIERAKMENIPSVDRSELHNPGDL